MMIGKLVVCPICEKKTCLRIQDGGYLNEYPVRVICMNCRALLKGKYIMDPEASTKGLIMYNAEVEEAFIDECFAFGSIDKVDALRIRGADYVAEISGELPCKPEREYHGGIPDSPYLSAVDYMVSVQNRLDRLTHFTADIEEWGKTKSIAFQLLSEGSIEYIGVALGNRMGAYKYNCDHYLKSIHCLQEVLFEESKYLFVDWSQDDYYTMLISQLSKIDKEELHLFCQSLGGTEDLIQSYRKAVEVFSEFVNIYPNVLPAETYLHFTKTENANDGISTCSFSDLKGFYQDAYEALLSLLHIPVCLDNIKIRGGYQNFDATFLKVNKGQGINLDEYRELDNGTRLNKMRIDEFYQGRVCIPANRHLRNGIGHNNYHYDGVSQIITAYDKKGAVKKSLMELAIDCLRYAKSAVVLSEIILFLLREELRRDGVTTLVHPRFYKGLEPNDKCPCGSNRKYKNCCKRSFEALSLVK